jgi:hypothetical protein
MKSELIRQLWESYRETVIGPNRPQEQYDECEMAFYAGAGAMLEATNELAELPEDEAVAKIGALHAEKDAFYLKMARKAAAKRGH